MCQGIYLSAECSKMLMSYDNFGTTMEQLGFVVTHVLISLKIISLYINKKEISEISNDLFSNYIVNGDVTCEDCNNLQQAFHRKISRMSILFLLIGSCTALIKFVTSSVHLIYCRERFYYKELCSTVQPFLISFPESLKINDFQWFMCGFQSICLTFYAWQSVGKTVLTNDNKIYMRRTFFSLRYFIYILFDKD